MFWERKEQSKSQVLLNKTQIYPNFIQTKPQQKPNKFLYLGFGFCAITQQECTLQFEKM